MVEPHGSGEVVPLSAREEAAWRALTRAVLVIPRVIDADLMQDQGIGGTEYVVLMTLSEAPEGSMRMSQLASHVAISVSGLSRVVGRLERERLVERSRSADDGRGQVARITPAGLRCLEAAWPVHLASVRRRVMDHLQGVDLEAFATAMEQIAEPAVDSTGRRRARGPVARP
ncbi:MarR family transcriptional regulator [Aeromicrobium sp. 636]|uniref:Winged helix-turn-helix transcriptional regulator n=1 Tax=Aeromicrobium senzhongii TaxID=2663859 RepID=A0A8I0EWB0_9ACTN|nr:MULTISPECIES: MarR family winged helix-turn-helix transcriptional regulator [Aeromicrobium]MBC9226511.1 winged helix-turn-helix transcriptional regulator [Aeromicrobium senzhongii]MCQ3998615.1 MarR family transcriptional regulator [Aeromicrobium sp. 636]